jgi:hypothetical protein
MAITLPAFTPVEDSLFLTLYCRALDNRSSKPVLSDATAGELESRNPKLIREILLTREPEIAEYGRPPVQPVLGDQRNLVPEGDHRPALPLLAASPFLTLVGRRDVAEEYGLLGVRA